MTGPGLAIDLDPRCHVSVEAINAVSWLGAARCPPIKKPTFFSKLPKTERSTKHLRPPSSQKMVVLLP